MFAGTEGTEVLEMVTLGTLHGENMKQLNLNFNDD